MRDDILFEIADLKRVACWQVSSAVNLIKQVIKKVRDVDGRIRLGFQLHFLWRLLIYIVNCETLERPALVSEKQTTNER